MLTTQLTLHLQPVVKQTLSRLDDFQMLQGDVLISLGLVVAVDLLQPLVQQVSKQCQVVW